VLRNLGKEELEPLNSITSAELIRQTCPEELTEISRTEDYHCVINCKPLAAMVIASVFGFGLWVGILLAFLAIF